MPLAGGGTDIPEFYSKHTSDFISASIDKYVYVYVNHRFEQENRISYLKNEYVGSIDNIEHPLIREILKHFKIKDHIEVMTSADLPGTSGMGSSGAFGVALISAVEEYTGIKVNVPELAYDIERNILNRPIGKQDQYASYTGGLNRYTIDMSGNVFSTKLLSKYRFLSEHLALYFTGFKRDSSTLLKHLPSSEIQLLELQKLTEPMFNAINKQDIYEVGRIFDVHWRIKKSIASEMSHSFIDECYTAAMENGALGGKIIGAGGGGFLLFAFNSQYDHDSITKNMIRKGLDEVKFSVTNEGSDIKVW